MAILLNDEQLSSSKIDASFAEDWVIGPALKIDAIRVRKSDMGIDSKADEGGTNGPRTDQEGSPAGTTDENDDSVEIKSIVEPILCLMSSYRE